jgi:hypothetical protein
MGFFYHGKSIGKGKDTVKEKIGPRRQGERGGRLPAEIDQTGVQFPNELLFVMEFEAEIFNHLFRKNFFP